MTPRGLWPFTALALACSSAPSAVGPAAGPAALFEQAAKAHAGPSTLSCDAKAFVQAPQNSGRYELHVSVERPDSLRIEALTPVGDPAAVLVASGGRFSLLDLRNNVFYRGPSTARNLARLLPVALRPEELVAVITGGIPELPGAQPSDSKRQGDGSLLTFKSGETLQQVSLGADLRVVRVLRTLGPDKVLWDIKLDQHDDASGAELPMLLQFDAPDAKTKVDLRLRNVATAKEPPRTAFELKVPQGVRVEDVR
jgi:outer membrane lipoprotein-sorting protein